MISHDLNEVFRPASRVIHHENGTIKRIGTSEGVFLIIISAGRFKLPAQMPESIARTPNIVTVIVGGNQIIKVIAFDSDLENLKIGDHVTVFPKLSIQLSIKLN